MILQKRPGINKLISNKPVSKGLDIQQSTGQVSIYQTTWMIIGLPGVGKTTLASGFDGCLYLCTSKKEIGRLQVPFLIIDSWEKALDITDELINNRQKYYAYKYIVIDFVDAVWTLCVAATCDKLGVSHTSDAAYGKGVDTVDSYFKRWITTLVASDYGIIFISHVNQKDVIVPGGTITKTICSLPPRARMILFPLVNVIGCIEYRTMKQLNTVTGKAEIVKRRVISFTGNEYIEAKDRDSVLPEEVVLSKDPKKNFETFKKFYDASKEG
jgi:GTPase SAR1 family protein